LNSGLPSSQKKFPEKTLVFSGRRPCGADKYFLGKYFRGMKMAFMHKEQGIL
jgi:hypothetical protein